MTIESWQRRPGLLPALRSAVARPLRLLATPRRLPRSHNLVARAIRRAAWLSGRAAHLIAWSTVEPSSQVVARTPHGGRVQFAAKTALASSTWETGEFELEELLWSARLATPGSYAIDVGANVGLFTVDLSRAVGPTGRVIAVEASPATADLLRSSIESNDCRNVDVVVAAAAAVTGEVELKLTPDPAHPSIAAEMLYGQIPVGTMKVPGVTLDDLWLQAGRPQVSFVKIDVEGAELDVLRGALEMIAACRPQMIVEVFYKDRLGPLIALLPRYEAIHVDGYISWNYLFRPIG